MAHKAFRVISIVLLVALLMSVFTVTGFAASCKKCIIADNQLAYFTVRTGSSLSYLWKCTGGNVRNTGKHVIHVYVDGVWHGSVQPGRTSRWFYLNGRNRLHTIKVQRSYNFGINKRNGTGPESALVWTEAGSVW